MPSYLVGIDGGGTTTKLVLQDMQGRTLASTQSGPGNIRLSVTGSWQSINSAFQEALTLAQIDINDPACEFHAGLGLAGTEVPAFVRQFLSTPHRFKTLRLESDAHTACLGAHAGNDGAILIIGTGVIAYGIANKHILRIGGWGFPQGDEGGGAWIGLEAIRYTLHMIDGRIPSTPLLDAIFKRFHNDVTEIVSWANSVNATRFAEFAPLVVEYADQGMPRAQQIMEAAGMHINSVAHALLQRSPKASLALSLFGGLAPLLEKYLNADIKQRITPRIHDATFGALIMVKQSLGLSL